MYLFYRKGMTKNTKPTLKQDADRNNVNEQLLKSKFFLDALMDYTSDYIYFKDEDSRFLKTSRSHLESFGLGSQDEVVGKSDYDFFTEDHAHKAYQDEQRIISTGTPLTNMEEDEVRLKGNRTWASTSKWPLKDDAGRIIGTFGISRDISQKKEDEKKLTAYSKELSMLNATKDKFFSIIAHDLRGPLSALVGFSDLVALAVEQNDISLIKRNVKIIQKASYQALDLLSNLLEWARSQTGSIAFNPEMINLGMLAEEMVNFFSESSRQKRVRLHSSVPKDLFVLADKSMTGTILRNLVSNAIKFTRPGGEVEILSLEREDTVEVSVKDNGVGLCKEDVCKLFSITSQFSKPGTAREKGTGLGLILCREFAEKQGGKIWAASKLDRGSTFTFSIPLI